MTTTELLARLSTIQETLLGSIGEDFKLGQLIREIENSELIENRTEYRDI